ncbi:reverse transcriptase family protein [Aporhodopirellula aestuarii]|uniref:RNA-directed DNA polymerase n=1 Tax=Aporhodopirellula aestuarii TaxID=2950107 RepID=A0ABT0U3E9_9BACT|nr:reverse transcriptase family protein [Aporhodopirellula aestuarii]MCM2371419.1 reverse transcriptase family protein [Aporhodopirellula aestuarii]
MAHWLKRQPHFVAAKHKKKTFAIWVQPAKADDESACPLIASDIQLVDFLELPSSRVLDWLLLPHRRRRTEVDHYSRRWLRGHNGRSRLIEEPRPLLKRVQRLINAEILTHLVIHDVAHAYQPGRSVMTCASPHVGQRVVLKMDLQNFFGTISLRRVAAQFRRCGYDRPIALSLAQLCTAPAIPPGDAIDCSDHFTREHLPQGAPTSPTLANAVAFQMDRRLIGLSNAVGITYTRYADDLFFSGDSDFACRVNRFSTTVALIAMEEGFTVAHRKTRTMFDGHRQRVLGLTVNQKLNSGREEYERLKAILTNCYRHGWRSQNRDNHPHFADHLRGRIAHVSQCNANRGQKLMQLFNKIPWNQNSPTTTIT